MNTPSAGSPARVPISETYKAKFIRKFKEQPFVPIGAVATTVALTVAMVKMRQGKSKSFNNWLRVRVIAQGLTIVAIVGGSFALGQTKQQKELQAAQEQERQLELAAKERREFEERMKAAEEAHKLEVQFTENRSKSWLGWGNKETGDKGARTETTAPTVSAAPAVEVPAPPPPPPNAGEGKSAGLWERLWSKKS